jgi:hypothetical protein
MESMSAIGPDSLESIGLAVHVTIADGSGSGRGRAHLPVRGQVSSAGAVRRAAINGDGSGAGRRVDRLGVDRPEEVPRGPATNSVG